MPCAAYLNGEYGVRGIYVGVPVVIGAGGVEKIIEIPLNAGERKRFDNSVKAVRELVGAAKRLRKKPAKGRKRAAAGKGRAPRARSRAKK